MDVKGSREETQGIIEDEVGVVYTIYEETTHQSSSSCSLAFPEDTTWILPQQLLQRSICSWREATGFPPSVTVYVKGRTFKLHKFPLNSKSGFFKRRLKEGNEVHLTDSFPGGPETFEVVAAYCYASTIVMNPSNIAALRCASEFLELTEEYCRGNLCKRSELYFNQVILKNWDDSIEVLRNCKNLHPMAEEMLIVNSCIEAISLMAVVDGFENNYQLNDGCEDWWINDLLTLPFDYFGQFISCVRRRGMQEKLIGRAMLFYVDRWIFEMLRASENSISSLEAFSRSERKGVIESIVRLLPADKDVMPVSFFFAMLRCALAWNASLECRAQLERRITAQLEQATVTDFLLPLKTEAQLFASRTEIESMQQIVSRYISQKSNVDDDYSDSLFRKGTGIRSSRSVNPCISTVAKVWDEYLAEIAFDPKLSPPVFLNLIHTIPSSTRISHDRLYKAIHIYLKTHPQLSEQQTQNICKTLNCQKLSKQACVHAVQNDLLPLRMIVQAIFMHQLQTHSSSNRINPNGIYKRKNDKGNLSLGCILKRDEAFHQTHHLKAEFDETSRKLSNLEEEIAQMRITLTKANYAAPLISSKQEQGQEQQEDEENLAMAAEGLREQPRLTNKRCSSGVTRKFVRSLRKFSLKKGKQSGSAAHAESVQNNDGQGFQSRKSRMKLKESLRRRHTRNR